jgi:hypothetical protein
MTSSEGDDPGERFIIMKAWLAVDLLRLLNQLRAEVPAWLGTAVRDEIRDDLDYHAGLLRVRLHHDRRRHLHDAAQPQDKGHP